MFVDLGNFVICIDCIIYFDGWVNGNVLKKNN